MTARSCYRRSVASGHGAVSGCIWNFAASAGA